MANHPAKSQITGTMLSTSHDLFLFLTIIHVADSLLISFCHGVIEPEVN